METSEHIEQCFTDIRDYIEELKETIGSLGHLNRTISSTAQKGIRELESRLAQVERERDAAVNELPHNCWNCIYHRDTPIEEIDTGGLTIHRYCDADYCYPEEENSSWKWRGVCEENTKEEK